MKNEKPDKGKKPEDRQELVDNIAEASKNARKIYLLYLGFLAYCALTAISTTDRALVLNEPAHLPIVNVGVPLEGFFIFAPILAIMTFIYFQFYLQKLKNLKSKHEKDFGKIDENRVYPWIVNFLDFPQHGFIGFLQKFVVKFALWWSLPSVLIIFALYYVKKHDLWMSYYLGLLPLIATLLVVLFRINYEKERFGTLIKEKKLGLIAIIILIIGEIFFMVFIIPWSMEGGKYDFLKPWLCVDLSNQNLVTEPETDYEGLYWADFDGVHLEGARLNSAVLKRADLRYAHLKGAVSYNANLREADLSFANLQEARLVGANLREAYLERANLRGADLAGADLQEADLSFADLQGADLSLASLQGARLVGANLQGAKLLDADLQGANLGSADLQGADLYLANLREADLGRANLQEADLRRVENLTIEQLSEVKTLYEAELDSALFDQVKAQYPHLLEPPEEEEE